MKISLADGVNADVDIEPAPGSTLAKYLKAAQAIRLTGDLPLGDQPLASARAGLDFGAPVPLGTDRVELVLKAGLSGGIHVLTADTDGFLFGADPYGDPVPISPGQAFVGAEVQAELSAELAARAGDLTFGFDGGGGVTLASYRRFPSAGTGLREAVRAAIHDFSVPGDIDDLQRMPDGSVAVVTGHGQLRFAGEATLVSAVNPLATASLPVAGDIGVMAGATVNLAASLQFTGEYQVRVQKAGSRVRLGVLRKKGRSFDLSVEAVATIEATVRGHDLVELLMRAVSSDWEAETEAFERAGLTEAQIGAIEATVEQSLRRKLELAFRYELAAAAGESQAFLFDIDLDALDAKGRTAVHAALDGDLRALTGASPGSLTGVVPVRSLFSSMRERKHTLGINLLGVFNGFSVSRLVTSGSVMVDADSGDLLIADSVTADRVRGTLAGWLTDPLKLQRLLAESVLATAVYRCAGAIAVPPALTLRHTYVEHHAKTGRGVMKDNLDVPQALGLLAAPEKQRLLDLGTEYGPTTLHVEACYDDAALRRAFLDNGKGRPSEVFERAGLQALLDLIESGERDDYRRLPGERAEVWDAMKKAGPSNVRYLPAVRQRVGDAADSRLKSEILAGDYALIVWWADSMEKLGESLEEIIAFVNAHPEAIAGDHRYRAMIRQLSDRLTNVVRHTKERFGDPWGIVAMDIATGRTAGVSVQVASSLLAWRAERQATSTQDVAVAV
jgi:hypothetical protein